METSVALSANSQNAQAKIRNRPSRVRDQKRRKKRPATVKPAATKPAMKLFMASSIRFPDEAVQQHAHRQQRCQLPVRQEIDLHREDDDVDEEQQVVERQEDETQST